MCLSFDIGVANPATNFLYGWVIIGLVAAAASPTYSILLFTVNWFLASILIISFNKSEIRFKLFNKFSFIRESTFGAVETWPPKFTKHDFWLTFFRLLLNPFQTVFWEAQVELLLQSSMDIMRSPNEVSEFRRVFYSSLPSCVMSSEMLSCVESC